MRIQTGADIRENLVTGQPIWWFWCGQLRPYKVTKVTEKQMQATEVVPEGQSPRWGVRGRTVLLSELQKEWFVSEAEWREQRIEKLNHEIGIRENQIQELKLERDNLLTQITE